MNKITVNYLFDSKQVEIKPSSVKREWMDKTLNKFAYRCLPMTIVNQCSWDALCPSDIEASWSGKEELSSVQVKYLSENNFKFASSLFGHGILTFHVDFVLQTNDNINLYIKGSANNPKPFLTPLEGIVETNWLPFTFTANWIFTSPGTVSFKKGEPLFSFFPIDVNFVESFNISEQNISEDEKFKVKYENYASLRDEHVKNKTADNWQKFYMKGIEPLSNTIIENHRTKLNLKKI